MEARRGALGLDCVKARNPLVDRWKLDLLRGHGRGMPAAIQNPRARRHGHPAHRGQGSAAHVSRFDERIYYNRGDEIWSVSAAGNDERRLSGMPLLPPEFSRAWVLTGEGIYFVDGNLPALESTSSSTTGRTNRVVDLTGRPAPNVGALAFSANRLLYPQIDGLASDIMLVDLR